MKSFENYGSRITSGLRRAALGVALLVPTSAVADVIWIGEVFVTAVSGPNPTCQAVGNFSRSVFRPKDEPTRNIVDNGPDTFLTMTNPDGGGFLQVPGAEILASGTARQGGISGRGGPSGCCQDRAYGNGVIAPAAFNATTKYLTIVIRVNNWNNAAGCNVTYKGHYVREQ